MGATLTTVQNITKEVYGPRIVDQLQNEVVGYKRIEQSGKNVRSEVGGKYVTFPIRVKRNVGIGYRNENELLQNAGQQGYLSVRVGLKYGYGRVNMSGQTMDLVDTNYQAFAEAMNLEMTGLKNDIMKDTNRIFYGDGTGALATTTAAGTASNTYVAVSTKNLEVGQSIDIVTAATSTVKAATRTITAISGSNVTFDGAAATWASGDIIVRTGNVNREPQGLTSIVKDSGVLFNVDPSTDPVWKAVRNHNSGTLRALSEGLMIKVTDDTRVNGGNTSLILCSLGVRRAYFNLLSQQRRYTNTKEFAGGLSGLAFNNGREIPVVEDVDAPDSKMWFLDESTIKIHRDKPWSFLERDGNIWKWVNNYDAYEAVLKQYWEIGVYARNNNGVLEDITEG